jgi:6-phosphogluconolactonase
MIELYWLETADDIANEAAKRAAEVLAAAQAKQPLVTFVLAGGRLPPIAAHLLSTNYAKTLDWQRILLLIGDERCVPLDSPDANWPSIEAIFSEHPEIPTKHQLRPPSNLPAEQAAQAYDETVRNLPHDQAGRPVINHMWLGIGEDGHTLSLFLSHPSLAEGTDSLVIPVHDSPKPPPDRISFSLRALEGVESALVFVSGASKAPILAQIAAGDHTLPIVVASKIIEKAGGHVTWLIDSEAASQIPERQSLVL